MPVVATNTPTNINAAANTAGKSGTSAPAKDSDDKSFSDFLTAQTPDKTPNNISGKTDAAPKTKSAETKAANPPAGKSAQVSIAKNTKAPADAKSGGRKSDDVKQDQPDTQTDTTDNAPTPDVQLASNVVQQPLLLPPDAGGQDDDSNGSDDAGNQNGQSGKDTVPAADAAAAPDDTTPPPLPQINNDAMAAAANQAAAANTPPPPVPVPPPTQTTATTGIDATQKGPRPRLQPPVQADATAPQTVADSDSDADSTPAGAPAPVTAGAAPQPPVATAQNSQDDTDQDGSNDDATAPAAPAQIAASTNTPAPQPASVPTAPAVAPPPHTRAPRTVTAQNDTQTATDTAPADSAPAKTAPPINQPQGIASADNSGQTPSASQTSKPGTSDFKVASAKDSDSQTQDTRSAADPNIPAPPAPQAPQPPAPSPVIALATGIAPQPITGSAPPAVTTSVHVGPQTPDVTPNVNSLAVEIAAKSQSGAKQFDIRLDPPELGRVEVRLSIDATGKAEAHMTADQPQTLHLLQKDSETLTRALRDAGLDVSQNGLNFSLRGQDRQNSNGQNNSGQGGNFRAFQATKVIEAVPTNAIAYSSTGNARLDIHV